MTPAKLLQSIIQAKATQLGYAVSVNHMQDSPAKMIMIMDTRGRVDEQEMRGDQTERNGVEIHVRGTDHADTAAVLPALWTDVLEGTYGTSVSGKIVHCITKLNTMGCLGQEPQTRRWRFSQQFLMSIK